MPGAALAVREHTSFIGHGDSPLALLALDFLAHRRLS